MTARDQVKINRDYRDRWGRWQHSRMTVRHDTRVFDPSFELAPGTEDLVGIRGDGEGIRILSLMYVGTGAFEARSEWNDLPEGRTFGSVRGVALPQ